MSTYVILIRGINVGGKNKVSMADLRLHLESLGYTGARTYINSGNVIIESNKRPKDIQFEIETHLPRWFKLDSELIKALAVSKDTLANIIHSKPSGFGEEPLRYHSDAIFLINVDEDEAFAIFSPKEGVDAVWKGDGVIYSRRLSSERTKSRLSKIMSSPLYKSMTIRSWNTTTKLYELIK